MNMMRKRRTGSPPPAGVLGIPIPDDPPPVLPHAGILGERPFTVDAVDPRIPHPGILGEAIMAPEAAVPAEPPAAEPAEDTRPRLSHSGIQILVQARDALAQSQREAKRDRADNVRLARENSTLRTALKKTLDMSIDSPVFVGGLGGRTAVEKYRQNAGRLVQLLNGVGNQALLRGRVAAKFFLRGPIKLDLEALWAAAPATVEEGLRRDDLRRKLTVDEELELLAGTDETSELARQKFISALAGSGIDTSAQEIFRRSGEMPAGKDPRPDDD